MNAQAFLLHLRHGVFSTTSREGSQCSKQEDECAKTFLNIFEASELAIFHGDNSPEIAKKGGERKIICS